MNDQGESEDDRLMGAYWGIIGTGPVDDLVEVLRAGELPPVFQKQLADALDPKGETLSYFRRQSRVRGKGPMQMIRSAQTGMKYRRIATRVGNLEGEGMKLEAIVALVMAEEGVSRETVFRALRAAALYRTMANPLFPQKLTAEIRTLVRKVQRNLGHWDSES